MNKTCVIPDIHQNTTWADAVMRRESDCDLFIFLGDIFDSYKTPPDVTGIRETAKWLKRIIHNPKCIVLWGNHDIAYMEDCKYARKHVKNHRPFQECAGFTRNKSEEIAKEITWVEWGKTEPFKLVNGWLLSHAGFDYRFWRNCLNIEDNLDLLYQEAMIARNQINMSHARWFFCDYLRGGDDEYSGPIWQDFQEAFEDVLPLPQIVGHTPYKDQHTVQQIGRSFDIDGGQSTYAIIETDGKIAFKSIEQIGEEWKEAPVNTLNIDSFIATRANKLNIEFLK